MVEALNDFRENKSKLQIKIRKLWRTYKAILKSFILNLKKILVTK